MNDRAKTMQFLENAVKGAFSKGLKASIGGFDYLFLKRGEEVEVGDHLMVTTESGIFQKAPVLEYNHNTKLHEVVRHNLLHYGHAEQLSGILDHLCRDMSIHDIEMTLVGVTSHSALAKKSIQRQENTGEAFAI